MVRIVDRTLSSPKENLAFDESLLHLGRETLRLWESPAHFIVLGRSGRVEEEVNMAECEAAGIPVLRRSSGGGTVLQGPGCLNYAFTLSLSRIPKLANVPASYAILLNGIARSLRIPGLEVRGTDILLRGKKVSGNAQRRTGTLLLHHGTLLHGLDLALMERLLLEPTKQPAHRAGKTHRQFVTALEVPSALLKQRIINFWTQLPTR
jgi:lipoate-protein ligase A